MRNKTTLFTLLILGILFYSCTGSNKEILPIPSTSPSEAQLKQIERKYGMFIHFGINTFHDQEWTDGSKPASSYAPTAIDADQWVKTAKDSGMKYVILITKHHDGFCLWDSKYTEYDIANSGNTTDVVEAVAKACEKYDIGLGLYYSLWDRNRNAEVENVELDSSYNSYMIQQLNELMDITQKHTNIVEFWFDGGWLKENNRWPINDIYQTIKSREPDCQVGVNWTIGLPENPDFHPVLPADQKEGYPIRYFPSDFRLGDPYLPIDNDPKLFSHNGEEYYMPWESTVCISKRWFYNTQDSVYKPIDELVEMYKVATSQDNILILNCPPNREGKIRDEDIEILAELRKRLDISI
ncbi:alpha-L-fucosidase [Algoriphagus chordae]|uniref:alpha-L-fucosidase n=1 Tax=Algoriphagus chordae TaxID=237019 RepID=A0A2W7QS34_9BACT|nr:alpha-L-fucosidase [Algoriphagus chordae]PZX51373.1 alpha-L-fucosidase [Algoriphagus chordae]